MAQQPNTASQEYLLLDYAQRLERHRDGRRGVHVHLSRLKPQNRREHHIRIAMNTLDDFVQTFEGQSFLLGNGDLIFVVKGASLQQMDDAVMRMRYLFSEDPLTQARVGELARGPGIVLLCGRYEGLDERVLDAHGLDEISLGDFVLSGGEAAAIAVIDACVRLLPGVVGAPESLIDESFENGLLEYPQYTRPREWRGRTVPEVLVSGDHKKVKAWRRHQAKAITRERRPDLWARYAGGNG